MRPPENERDDCHPDCHPDGHPDGHPLVGRVALMAIVVSMLAIVWAKVEVLGTRNLERTLTEESVTLAQQCVERLEAVALNRWATGFSP